MSTFCCVRFEENGGLLEVVTKKAKRCQEQNQLDRSGNSALHMVAKFPPGNKMAKEVCEILLENQVNPLLQNNDQKTARDLTSPKDKYVTKLLKRHEGISIYYTFIDYVLLQISGLFFEIFFLNVFV